MQDDYAGPDMQTVPIGWFSEAAGVAASAAPGGIAISITLSENGFQIEARRGEVVVTKRLSFFDIAMEDAGNPFLPQINQAVSKLRAGG